jgi:hypothetical protein
MTHFIFQRFFLLGFSMNLHTFSCRNYHRNRLLPAKACLCFKKIFYKTIYLIDMKEARADTILPLAEYNNQILLLVLKMYGVS